MIAINAKEFNSFLSVCVKLASSCCSSNLKMLFSGYCIKLLGAPVAAHINTAEWETEPVICDFNTFLMMWFETKKKPYNSVYITSLSNGELYMEASSTRPPANDDSVKKGVRGIQVNRRIFRNATENIVYRLSTRYDNPYNLLTVKEQSAGIFRADGKDRYGRPLDSALFPSFSMAGNNILLIPRRVCESMNYSVSDYAHIRVLGENAFLMTSGDITLSWAIPMLV